MSASRTQNGIRNISASVVNRIVLIILPFITRTLIVKILGDQYLGLNSLFVSILSVLNLAELGFGSALVYSMYKPIADGDIEKVGSLLKAYKKIYMIIGVLILVTGSILAPIVPKLINGTWPKQINIYVVYFLYLINTAISYLGFAHKKALLIAYQRSDIKVNINTILSIVLYLCQIVLLVSTKNYYLYLLCLPIFTLLENIFTAIYVRKKYSNIKEQGNLDRQDKAVIVKHVKGIALQKVCSASRNSFDSIVISLYMGLTSIAIYNNYFYILSAVHTFLYQIPNSIRASVGNSIAETSLEKNYQDFNVMTLIYAWISGVCACCLMCLYQPFMKIWMGDDMLLPMTTVTLLCIYFYELSMSDITALYKDGAGLWWYGRYRTIVEAILNLILNFVLGYIWGINGILLATIITLTFVGHGYGGYIIFCYYFKGARFCEYLLLQIKYFLIMILVAIITYMICDVIGNIGFLEIVIKGIVCVVVSNILYWVIFRKQKYYGVAKTFVGGMLKTLIKR